MIGGKGDRLDKLADTSGDRNADHESIGRGADNEGKKDFFGHRERIEV